MMSQDAANGEAGSGIDRSIPHSARIWNYWLGGKDNYAVDRAAGDAWIEVQPEIVAIARTSRAFLARVVRHLAGEAGVRQFLDIGTGLPTAENTHQIAQRVAPDARIVYVDHDPLVLTHARALLTSTPEGSTRYLDADMHDTSAILKGAAESLDLTKPVALLFMGVLGHVTDDEQAYRLVDTLFGALPSGSYLAIFDGAEGLDGQDDTTRHAEEQYSETGAHPYRTRSAQQVATFFGAAQWVEPGFVRAQLWRPDATPGVTTIGGDTVEAVDAFGGVARKA